ncbi:hypothetical protein FOT49_25240 [Citrobacter freundii]|uniref:Uncharacterized protein n=1 Tax=Klebsiella michiganensis TaxID=1134687 RepID=A0A2J4PJB5_9ENTR|nr:hypothetical protein EHF43_27455 [Klebsiella pneumoniae]EDD0137561.1 hypothetical protein [Salmonella enterica subsp. enterica serovar Newport]EEZ0587083.1 hypothetical protein [Escherichia coli]MBD9993074.1 hypothetical protein [Citrobacter freundii]PLL18879.1 hypothetical protein CWN50_32605 [Klebsiella michiganensis]TNJ96654.1 hypothetical protein CI664_026665 [Klebsiella quasipneumoniae subsp. similipneumoniae]
MPENPASYRVVRTKSYLFNKAPAKSRDLIHRQSRSAGSFRNTQRMRRESAAAECTVSIRCSGYVRFARVSLTHRLPVYLLPDRPFVFQSAA